MDDNEFANLNKNYIDSISKLKKNYKCLHCKDILAHSEKIIDIKRLEAEIEKETLLLSDGGLSLLPEYNKRVEVYLYKN